MTDSGFLTKWILASGAGMALGFLTFINVLMVLGFGLNFAVGAVLISFDYTRDAALLFYGASMLLAAARGYAGCEVLAITNWVLRRDDQVGCVLFSPLDEIESKTTGSAVTQT